MNRLELVEKYNVVVTEETISCDLPPGVRFNSLDVELDKDLMKWGRKKKLTGATVYAVAVAEAIDRAAYHVN